MCTVTITEDTIAEKPGRRGTTKKKVQAIVQVHRTEPEMNQLKEGDIQNLVFKEGDAAPWMQTLKPNDMEGGWVGQPKGIKQILYQQDLWRAGMKLTHKTN